MNATIKAAAPQSIIRRKMVYAARVASTVAETSVRTPKRSKPAAQIPKKPIYHNTRKGFFSSLLALRYDRFVDDQARELTGMR
jgi:hypothetical protein